MQEIQHTLLASHCMRPTTLNAMHNGVQNLHPPFLVLFWDGFFPPWFLR